MSRLTYVPRPPLSALIHFMWAYDAYGAGHRRERVLPGPVSELVVVLRGARPGTVFCGAQSESFIIETADRPALLGVHFKPGGAFPFLRRMPADELHNQRVSLEGTVARGSERAAASSASTTSSRRWVTSAPRAPSCSTC